GGVGGQGRGVHGPERLDDRLRVGDGEDVALGLGGARADARVADNGARGAGAGGGEAPEVVAAQAALAAAAQVDARGAVAAGADVDAELVTVEVVALDGQVKRARAHADIEARAVGAGVDHV